MQAFEGCLRGQTTYIVDVQVDELTSPGKGGSSIGGSGEVATLMDTGRLSESPSLEINNLLIEFFTIRTTWSKLFCYCAQ